MDNTEKYLDILAELVNENRLRSIPEHREPSEWMDLCSNDYMGLRRKESSLKEKFLQNLSDHSFSASASRLLALDQGVFTDMEDFLERIYHRPALLFNSGYHANAGITSALNVEGTLFVADKLIHASMIDGLRIGRCEMKRFRHNDLDALRTIIQKEAPNYKRIVVMVESIYSMDGDKAPLRELVVLKKEYPSILIYLDEAHAFGVRGTNGLGLAEEVGVLKDIDILVGTLGKAACSAGAFVITSPMMKKYLINTARSFIFSTALPPINIAWSKVTVYQLFLMWNEREHLRDISVYLRKQLRKMGYDVPEDDTPIVPLLTGDASKAIALSEHLKSKGILALPIRRPTVPPGGERIRISLNASLSIKDMDYICNALT